MLRPTDWPIWHDDPWQNPQLRDGIAPLRHDIALAHYLEKQRTHRVSTVRRFDLIATAIRLRSLVAGFWRDVSRRLRPAGGGDPAVRRVRAL